MLFSVYWKAVLMGERESQQLFRNNVKIQKNRCVQLVSVGACNGMLGIVCRPQHTWSSKRPQLVYLLLVLIFRHWLTRLVQCWIPSHTYIFGLDWRSARRSANYDIYLRLAPTKLTRSSARLPRSDFSRSNFYSGHVEQRANLQDSGRANSIANMCIVWVAVLRTENRRA
jgi:hypothetical protein